MNPITEIWAAVGAAIGGAGAVTGYLALFVVPAAKRYEDMNERLKELDSRVQSLEERNGKLTAAVAVLVGHDEMLRAHIKRIDPGADLSSASDILALVGMSLELVLVPGKATPSTPTAPKSGV